MVKVGDRIRLSSGKGLDREGVVTAVMGSMLRVRWPSEDETTLIPAPGTLTVLAPSGDQAPLAERPERVAPKKKAAPKKAAPKKATAKKATAKKATAKKATAKKAAPKKATAKKSAPREPGTAGRTAGSRPSAASRRSTPP